MIIIIDSSKLISLEQRAKENPCNNCYDYCLYQYVDMYIILLLFIKKR